MDGRKNTPLSASEIKTTIRWMEGKNHSKTNQDIKSNIQEIGTQITNEDQWTKQDQTNLTSHTQHQPQSKTDNDKH